MLKLVLVGLLFSTCLGPADCKWRKLKKLFKLPGKIIKNIFRSDKVETGLSTNNGNVANRDLDSDVKTEIKKMSEEIAKVANSASRFFDNATDVLIPEFVNIAHEIQGRIGQGLDNVNYILKLLIALTFIFVGWVCGNELRRVGYILRARGFTALEIYVLKWSRIVCFFSAFLLIVGIALQSLQISLFSKPEMLLFFILFPILSVFSYYELRLLIFLYHLLCIGFYYLYFLVKYLLYPPYLILYYALLAPFVLTYECFVNRNTHPNRIGALIIYFMPVVLCLLYCGCEEVMETLFKATEKENSLSVHADAEYSLTWLYSLVVTFVTFYVLAVVLRFYFPPPARRPFIAGHRNRR